MTFFQVFLSISFLIFIVFSSRFINLLWERIITIIITICGVYLVISPTSASTLAKYVGIGRGADLVFYLFILYSWFRFSLITFKMQSTDKKLTVIVRNNAINSPIIGGKNK
jgi:hypothetical protein